MSSSSSSISLYIASVYGFQPLTSTNHHSQTPLSYVFSLDFSPNSGYLAVGNDKGKVLLYRLRHYGET